MSTDGEIMPLLPAGDANITVTGVLPVRACATAGGIEGRPPATETTGAGGGAATAIAAGDKAAVATALVAVASTGVTAAAAAAAI